MKTSLVAKLVVLVVMTANLAGCIIRPWWYEGDHGHHHGEYHHEHRGGGHHDEDRRGDKDHD